MLKRKLFWPTYIFWGYTIIVLLSVWILYGLKDLEWGQEGNFFESRGFVGLLLQYLVGSANLLAINPLILGLKLVNCGGSFFSLCLPSITGVVLNLLIFSVLIFILNLAIVKFIERRRQRRMVTTKGN